MRYIISESKDVYYNLALEEYIFENYLVGDFLILYVNEDAVVLGKNQNIYEEVSIKQTESLDIKIARRMTGGGTVFHDIGNLNYSLIKDYDPDKLKNYDEYLLPAIEILAKLGVPAKKQNISDIAVEGKKISGSAQRIKKNRIIHHGTLLFDSNLDSLKVSIKPMEALMKSNSVKSVRSETTNIKNYITDKNMDIKNLENAFVEYFQLDKSCELGLTKRVRQEITLIAVKKYKSWQWTYGLSPDFTINKADVFLEKNFELYASVEKGIIRDCRIKCEALNVDQVGNMLIGKKYSYPIIKKSLDLFDKTGTLAECFF